MKALHKKVVAAVGLVKARISEDELAIFEAALSYILSALGDAEIERRIGATRGEVEGIRDDLREAMREHAEAEPVAEMTEKS
jgi:uncharacterized small protein (DUF1192 family)